jgi:hypothetical protein
MSEPAEHHGNPKSLLKPRGKAVTVFIPEEVHKDLRELAAVNERSVSAEIRYLVRRYTEEPDSFG